MMRKDRPVTAIPPLPGILLPACDDQLHARWQEEAEAIIHHQSQQILAAQTQRLAGLWAASPHLAQLSKSYLEGDLALLDDQQDANLCLSRIFDVASADFTHQMPKEDEAMMRAVRIWRNRCHHAVALLEASGRLSLQDSLVWLSKTADIAVAQTVRYLMQQAVSKEKLPAPDKGWAILALGKLGADELNYSSDIDIICLHDGEAAPASVFIDLTRRLVRILSAQTADGMGWRVDLRLRPDPGSTAISLSWQSALSYYESVARSWERAVFIRARPLAGDIALASHFLEQLQPFIWRRTLDYTILDDLQSWLRHLPASTDYLGFDIKHGAYGIRHIELLCQILQLLHGGHKAELRQRNTLDAYQALAKAKLLTQEKADLLSALYLRWRALEHRLQYQRNAQIHQLPRSEDDFTQFARLAGMTDGDQLRGWLRDMQEATKRASQDTILDDLVMRKQNTALPPEFEALTYHLEQLGYGQPVQMAETISNWRSGQIPATRGERARGYLEKLLPAFLNQIAQSESADAGFTALAQLIEGQPAAAQFFATLAQHEDLAGLLCELLTMAPRLTAQLRQYPGLIDSLIEPEFFSKLPDKSSIALGFAQIKAGLKDDDQIEESLDAIRLYARSLQFRADVHLLQHISTLDDIAALRSDLADFCLTEILRLAHQDMIRRHGHLSGDFGVIALGRLGSREMRSQSDLDLIFIYDAPADQQSDASEDAQRPLWTSSYFIRLAQRLVSWISVPTAQGRLYEVDARLRPDGQSGPLAVSRERLTSYYQHEAWDWEWLAMRQARLICGLGAGVTKLADDIARIQQHIPEPANYQHSISEMRTRLRTHHTSEDSASLKQLKFMPGGDLDIQFAQSLLDIAPQKSAEIGLFSDWLATHKAQLTALGHWQAAAFNLPAEEIAAWPVSLTTHFLQAVGVADMTSWQNQLARHAGQLDRFLLDFDAPADGKPDQHHHDK